MEERKKRGDMSVLAEVPATAIAMALSVDSSIMEGLYGTVRVMVC